MVPPAEPERLSAADASNLVMDAPDQVNAFLLAGTLGPGGCVSVTGEADLALLRSAIAARIEGPASGVLRRLTERVRVDQRDMTWTPCHPDLTWHIRLVDPVDGLQGLADLAATLMTAPLPLDRPLWELLIVPGAAPDGPGIILRLHHCVADGVAAVALVQRLFSGTGQQRPHDRRPTDTPDQADGSGRARAAEPADGSALAERVAERVAETNPGSGRRRQPWPDRWRRMATSGSRILAVFRSTVPPTVLLGPIRAGRGVAFADVDLAALARAARSSGATVNDALLSAVAVGAAAALRDRGEPVPPVLPASVPVALPGRGASGNAVGVMVVPLDTVERDPDTRLARIAAATGAAKAEARARGTFELTRTRWGSRAFSWLARRQRFIALFVTNVRGPDTPILVAGAPLRRVWPVAPIQGNVRLGVAAMSYAGRLGVTIHVDAAAVSAPVASRALGEELARIATPG